MASSASISSTTKSVKNQSDLVYNNQDYRNVTLKFNKCSRVTFNRCTFHDASVYFVECTDIVVQRCSFFRTNTRHALQCDKSSRITVSSNYFEEPIGTSKAEDIVNLYKSNTALVTRNYVRGGGPSKSGGGIILGDNMGSDQTASDNIVIDCGQYGMAIAGGNNNKLIRNTIMSRRYAWTNVGLYVWSIPQRNSRVTNATVTDNVISWKRRDGTNNSMWISPGDRSVTINTRNRLNVPYNPPSRPANVGK